MMKFFIATISPKYPKNYDQCKAVGMWGMTRLNPSAELVKKGDKIIFYLGGVGFVSIAEAQEKTHVLENNPWAAISPAKYKYGFGINFIEEFDEPIHYKFPEGRNQTIGVNTADFMFRAFFEISSDQFEKIRKGEGAESDERVKSEVTKGLQTHQVRTLVGELINYEGLIFGPVNEQGVIFLFSKIQKELGIIIESIQTGFPDARGRVKENKGWREVWIEFEYKSSNYLAHSHPCEPGFCDYIICWEDDWKNPPSHLTIINLQKELAKLAKGSTSKLISLLM